MADIGELRRQGVPDYHIGHGYRSIVRIIYCIRNDVTRITRCRTGFAEFELLGERILERKKQ